VEKNGHARIYFYSFPLTFPFSFKPVGKGKESQWERKNNPRMGKTDQRLAPTVEEEEWDRWQLPKRILEVVR
jgi:hypothetical protein